MEPKAHPSQREPGMRARAGAYVLAVVLPVAVMWLCFETALSSSARPFMIPFMLPIVVCALVGGTGPGLLATLLVLMGTAVWFIPPDDRFVIPTLDESPQWHMMIANGVLLSFLAGVLHRAYWREKRRRKQLESARRQLALSEERYRLTFELAAAGIALSTPDGHWLRANGRVSELLGYSLEELLARSYQDVSHEADRQLIEAGIGQVVSSNQTFATELRLRRRDGREIWVAVSVALAARPGSDADHLIWVIEDIDKRRRAEQALRASEAQYRTLFNTMQEGLSVSEVVRNSQGRVCDLRYLQVNPAFEHHTGLNPSQVIGKLASEIFAEFEPDWLRHYGRVIATGEAESFEAYSARLGRWLHVRAFRPSPDRFAALSFDISQRKSAEAAVQQLNADLERRVAERTAELTAANSELDAFAYAVSHDLRAPLRAMDGFSRALVEDCGNILSGEAKLYLDSIANAGRRMSDLIDGLLALSRCARGRMRWQAVDVSTLAEHILAELRSNDPTRLVAVDVQPRLSVSGDPRMLDSVLRNLLGNAWKYTARTSNARIRVHAEDDQGVRWICVSDNGIGFDMSRAAGLFEPFQRLHRADEYPGLGIGLATVQRIVHRHGGRIVAQAAPGRGASFRVALPAADPPEQAHLEEAA